MELSVRRLFFVDRRLRCCSNPPLRRFTNFQIKQKLQHLYDAGVLGGRGWMSQAALLKQPAGLFLRCLLRQRRSCSNPPAIMSLMFMQKKNPPVYLYTSGFFHGRGWIRTTEAEKAADLQSVPIGHSGTRPYTVLRSRGLPVYITTWGRICQLLFTAFQKRS